MRTRRLANEEPALRSKISNPYISVEINDVGLSRLRSSLLDVLTTEGVEGELSSPALHVSLAYGDCEATVEEVSELADAIASDGFNVRAHKFEILEGSATPFDYLVLSIDDAQGDFQDALGKIQKKFQTRAFKTGFNRHISLLRFTKGSLDTEWARSLVRELNASHGAASALGRVRNLEGECVCIYGEDRSSVCKIALPTAGLDVIPVVIE
jgi:hypothetical protein